MTTPRRLAAVALLTLCVVALHWAGLGGLRIDRAKNAQARQPALQVRSIAPVTPQVRHAEPPASPVPVAVAATAAPTPVRRPKPVPAEGAAEAVPAAPALSQAALLPIKLPPSVRWTYIVQRDALTGEGTLHWEPDGPAYTARLEARIGNAPVIDWASRGSFDATGVAPERYVERPRGRGAQAANFQREAGKITYSGPGTEHPLPPGAQDRLSWLLQLPAIVAASPERFAVAGAEIEMFVSGARGHAEGWSFRVVGSEWLELPGGDKVAALKLQREPLRLYDSRVEVWLDPARHHLPVRLRLSYEGSRLGAIELLHVPSP